MTLLGPSTQGMYVKAEEASLPGMPVFSFDAMWVYAAMRLIQSKGWALRVRLKDHP